MLSRLRRIFVSGSAILLLGILLFGCGTKVPPADLVLHNGKVVTVDASKPEAQAIAVRDGLVVSVGSNQEIDAHIGPATKVIDLAGRLALPGFIESHGHFTGVGQSKITLNLMKARNWDEIVAQVGAAAKGARAGEWILGRGWHRKSGIRSRHRISKDSRRTNLCPGSRPSILCFSAMPAGMPR